jgi:hypothetical protein
MAGFDRYVFRTVGEVAAYVGLYRGYARTIPTFDPRQRQIYDTSKRKCAEERLTTEDPIVCRAERLGQYRSSLHMRNPGTHFLKILRAGMVAWENR